MKCVICHHEAEYPTFTIREMMVGLREEFEYFQCTSCGCLQIASIPPDIAKYYGEEYYSLSTVKDDPNVFIKAAFDARTRHYIQGRNFFGKILSKRFPNPNLSRWSRLNLRPATRFLDVGCGTGIDLHYLMSAGFNKVHGVDPFIDETICYRNGLVIEKNTLDALEGTWDVVNLSHSLEHMTGQHEILHNIHRLLSDDGTAVISIPTVSSYAWEAYRERWFQADAPRHFVLHSRKSFEMIVEDAGLIIDDIVSNSNSMQFYFSELYGRDISMNEYLAMSKTQQEAFFSANTMMQYSQRSEELNREGRGDQFTAYLRKKR
jgi:SAM-dependent methyltransferase